MFNWTSFPFLRITAAWIFGILAGAKWFFGGSMVLYAILLFLILYMMLLIKTQKIFFYKLNVFHGFIMFVLLFLAGAFHSSRFDQSKKEHNLLNFSQIEGYSGTVCEGIQEKTKFNKTHVNVRKIITNGEWQKASGTVLLYFPPELYLKYGDELVVHGAPTEIPPPSNPNEFDYRRHLKLKNIFHQHFLKDPSQILIIDHDQRNPIYVMVLKVRAYATLLIKTYITGKQEQAVALALIIGTKDELDNALINAYGISGVMHVLAVSGLHVGILYIFLLTIFGNIRKIKHGRIIFAIITLLVLWFYAFLTGFASPVIRASIMFTAIILSQTFKRHTSVYNSLFFSAFIILLYNPYFVFNLGFQYSFMAVLGIVYLTPKIHRFWHIDFWLLDKIWLLICVAIAAQISTLPITIFNFNFFPSYFWAANVVVVPSAFIILASGFTFLIVGSWEWMGYLLGNFVEGVIWWMNRIVFAIQKIPGSSIDPLLISSTQAFLFYFFILAFLFFLYSKKLKYLSLGFSCLMVFIIIDLHQSLKNSQQSKIVFYNISGHPAIDFIDGKNCYLYTNDELFLDQKILNYSIVPYRIRHNVPFLNQGTFDLVIDKSKSGFDIIVFKQKTVVYVKDQIQDFKINDKIKADFLVIGNNSTKDLYSLMNYFVPNRIIIDGANARWLAARLYQQSQEMGLNCISLLEQGGQIIEL